MRCNNWFSNDNTNDTYVCFNKKGHKGSCENPLTKEIVNNV